MLRLQGLSKANVPVRVSASCEAFAACGEHGIAQRLGAESLVAHPPKHSVSRVDRGVAIVGVTRELVCAAKHEILDQSLDRPPVVGEV